MLENTFIRIFCLCGKIENDRDPRDSNNKVMNFF